MDITTILTIIAYIIVGACGLYVLLEIRNPQETPKETGCFVDDRQGESCVFDAVDGDQISECDVALELSDNGKGRDGCFYWRAYLQCSECGHISCT